MTATMVSIGVKRVCDDVRALGVINGLLALVEVQLLAIQTITQ